MVGVSLGCEGRQLVSTHPWLLSRNPRNRLRSPRVVAGFRTGAPARPLCAQAIVLLPRLPMDVTPHPWSSESH